MIICLAALVPPLSFWLKISAYSIQTQFAQPDMQHVFGGGGICELKWEISI